MFLIIFTTQLNGVTPLGQSIFCTPHDLRRLSAKVLLFGPRSQPFGGAP
jgi:hypothetical protein